MRELKYNLFLFQFYYEVDISQVLSNCPWAFDQSLLVLWSLQENENLLTLPLTHAEFWIQVHNLLIGFMSKNIANVIGPCIGMFTHDDRYNFNSTLKCFMWIQVYIDVVKPLKQERGELFRVDFRYEHLSTFCFFVWCYGTFQMFLCQGLWVFYDRRGQTYLAWLSVASRETTMDSKGGATMVSNRTTNS